jgi:hypothetical protein
MIRTQVRLTEDQLKSLKALAARQGVSVSEPIRRGIDIVLHISDQLSAEENRQRATTIVGQFRSDMSDVSTLHDHYLDDIYYH